MRIFNPIKPGLFYACVNLGGGVIFARGKEILISPLLFIARTREFSHCESWTLATNRKQKQYQYDLNMMTS